MTAYKRVFIIGHSGAGKGVLAQALAEKLGWTYIDMDFALEPSIGRRFIEILGAEGETKFRNCLTEILIQQLTKTNIVITTDDSIICEMKNRELLSNEFVVYLKVSTPVLLKRISHNRPLLPVPDYKKFLEQLRHERDDLYENTAKFSISSDDGKIDEHVSKIIEAMN